MLSKDGGGVVCGKLKCDNNGVIILYIQQMALFTVQVSGCSVGFLCVTHQKAKGLT